jgi:hypothetical protein
MAAEAGSALAPAPPWILSTPEGEVVVGDHVKLPDGDLVDDAAADAWLEARLGERIQWRAVPLSIGRVMMAVSLLLLVGLPWLWGIAFVSSFLWGFSVDGAR